MKITEHHDNLALIAIGDALTTRTDLHRLMEACPAPLHRWVRDQPHKILALALEAIEREEIPYDDGAIIGYLSRIRFSDALDAFKGKPLAMVAGVESGDDALTAGKIFSLMSDARSFRLAGKGVNYGTPARVATMLRCVCDRSRMITELERTTAALCKVSPMDDAGPILAPLGELIRTGSMSPSDMSLGDALHGAIEAAKRRSNDGGHSGITWGLKSLDDALPLRSGRLMVLSASPGGGKTSLGMQAAHATSVNLGFRSVAYLSLEMAAGDLALALACRECRVPRKQAEEQWGTLLEADKAELNNIKGRWQADGSLWIRDASDGVPTIAEVGTWIRSMRQRHGTLQLVVIDYLGLLKESNARHNLVEKTAEITRALKQIALAENIAIILLAQMTRDGRKTTRGADGQNGLPPIPRMEDLLGGSSIETDADGIVFLHPLQGEGEERRINAIVAKNRRGPFPVTFPLWFFGKHQFFQDADSSKEQDSDRKARSASSPSDSEACF